MSVLSSGLQQSRSRIWSDQAKTTGNLGWGFLFLLLLWRFREGGENKMQVCETQWCGGGLHLIRTSLVSLMAAKGQRVKWWRRKYWRLLFSLLLGSFHTKHVFLSFVSASPLFLASYICFYTFSPLPHILHDVFVASLVASSSAAWADIGVWFVRVNVIQRSIRSIRPMLQTPGGLGLCLAKLLMEVKTLSGKPLRAQQAQKNEPPLSLHIRSSATVAVPSQTPSHSTFVCSSLWTRDS